MLEFKILEVKHFWIMTKSIMVNSYRIEDIVIEDKSRNLEARLLSELSI